MNMHGNSRCSFLVDWAAPAERLRYLRGRGYAVDSQVMKKSVCGYTITYYSTRAGIAVFMGSVSHFFKSLCVHTCRACPWLQEYKELEIPFSCAIIALVVQCCLKLSGMGKPIFYSSSHYIIKEKLKILILSVSVLSLLQVLTSSNLIQMEKYCK